MTTEQGFENEIEFQNNMVIEFFLTLKINCYILCSSSNKTLKYVLILGPYNCVD